MSIDSCRRQRAAAASVLCCDPTDEDRHKFVKDRVSVNVQGYVRVVLRYGGADGCDGAVVSGGGGGGGGGVKILHFRLAVKSGRV